MKLQTLVLAGAVVLSPLSAGAAPILDFEDVIIPGNNDRSLITYQSQAFTLTAVEPTTGFSSVLQAHGSNSIFFMGSQALAAVPPASPPDVNIILSRDGGLPFSVTSIDLARNFPFDPAPTVTFIGTTAGGTVMQTFTVTTPAGVRAFQTFAFTGFTNLLSLEWGQPPLASGLHQFDNIVIKLPTTVPEPTGGLLLICALALNGAHRLLRRQRRR